VAGNLKQPTELNSCVSLHAYNTAQTNAYNTAQTNAYNTAQTNAYNTAQTNAAMGSEYSVMVSLYEGESNENLKSAIKFETQLDCLVS
jgi:hypothetical protein